MEPSPASTPASNAGDSGEPVRPLIISEEESSNPPVIFTSIHPPTITVTSDVAAPLEEEVPISALPNNESSVLVEKKLPLTNSSGVPYLNDVNTPVESRVDSGAILAQSQRPSRPFSTPPKLLENLYHQSAVPLAKQNNRLTGSGSVDVDENLQEDDSLNKVTSFTMKDTKESSLPSGSVSSTPPLPVKTTSNSNSIVVVEISSSCSDASSKSVICLPGPPPTTISSVKTSGGVEFSVASQPAPSLATLVPPTKDTLSALIDNVVAQPPQYRFQLPGGINFAMIQPKTSVGAFIDPSVPYSQPMRVVGPAGVPNDIPPIGHLTAMVSSENPAIISDPNVVAMGPNMLRNNSLNHSSRAQFRAIAPHPHSAMNLNMSSSTVPWQNPLMVPFPAAAASLTSSGNRPTSVQCQTSSYSSSTIHRPPSGSSPMLPPASVSGGKSVQSPAVFGLRRTSSTTAQQANANATGNNNFLRPAVTSSVSSVSANTIAGVRAGSMPMAVVSPWAANTNSVLVSAAAATSTTTTSQGTAPPPTQLLHSRSPMGKVGIRQKSTPSTSSSTQSLASIATLNKATTVGRPSVPIAQSPAPPVVLNSSTSIPAVFSTTVSVSSCGYTSSMNPAVGVSCSTVSISSNKVIMTPSVQPPPNGIGVMASTLNLPAFNGVSISTPPMDSSLSAEPVLHKQKSTSSRLKRPRSRRSTLPTSPQVMCPITVEANILTASPAVPPSSTSATPSQLSVCTDIHQPTILSSTKPPITNGGDDVEPPSKMDVNGNSQLLASKQSPHAFSVKTAENDRHEKGKQLPTQGGLSCGELRDLLRREMALTRQDGVSRILRTHFIGGQTIYESNKPFPALNGRELVMALMGKIKLSDEDEEDKQDEAMEISLVPPIQGSQQVSPHVLSSPRSRLQLPSPASKPLHTWDVTEVCQFVASIPGLDESSATPFRVNEIDGEALALLNEENLLDAPLSMKVGPAVKLFAHVRHVMKRDEKNGVGLLGLLGNSNLPVPASPRLTLHSPAGHSVEVHMSHAS